MRLKLRPYLVAEIIAAIEKQHAQNRKVVEVIVTGAEMEQIKFELQDTQRHLAGGPYRFHTICGVPVSVEGVK